MAHKKPYNENDYPSKIDIWNKLQKEEQNRINTTGLLAEEQQGIKNLISHITTKSEYIYNAAKRLQMPSKNGFKQEDIPTLKTVIEFRKKNISISNTFNHIKQNQLPLTDYRLIQFFYENLDYNEKLQGFELIDKSYLEPIKQTPEINADMLIWNGIELPTMPTLEDEKVFKEIHKLRRQGLEIPKIIIHLRENKLKLSNQELLFIFHNEIEYDEETNRFKRN